MEGVIDQPMRAFLSERGGFDFCVSEFIRVTQLAPPPHVFRRDVPELTRGARTEAGLSVQVQLLGGHPERVAEAALVAYEAGAPAIDLNFGCPAPTVNRNDGGAALLRFPARIRAIVAAVRRALPPAIPVSAKLRLGWDSIEEIHVNAEMAAEGGASWLTIHGRTKVQGYLPPAHWKPIGQVKRRLGLPIVANGEIWNLEDFRRCREESHCDHFMLGRGALADLQLVHQLRAELGLAASVPRTPVSEAGVWYPALVRFAGLMEHYEESPERTLGRIKQWVRLMKRPEPWIEPVKRARTLTEALELVREAELG
ncbi:MAG: tRNA-dihydrouridine synthase family protein [Oligoflexia bacterium]|nr:tRNA-dihydrouridine synthase family protein [Oligoflexia bacterium]